MKMFITVGISASGKTTWANQKVAAAFEAGYEIANINRDDIRFNVVFPGSDWSTYKFTRAREAAVTAHAIQMFETAKEMGVDVIISDTNLNEQFRNAWVERGIEAGYEIVFQEFPIELEEAWKRDAARANGVGHDVIYKQYKQWEEYKGVRKYVADESKPKAIIVDVDGTIADKGNRNPFEWAKVGEDTPREFIINMISLIYQQHRMMRDGNPTEIIFLSGRDSVCRHETLQWISKQFYMYDIKLFMRAEGDQRKDTIVKEELFWAHIAENYNVVAAFDDRPCVVRKWHEIGIPNVIAVADQHIEF